MDRYESLMDYAAAKHRIFSNQAAGDVAILNADDEIVSSWAHGLRAHVVQFSVQRELTEGMFLRERDLVSRGQAPFMTAQSNYAGPNPLQGLQDRMNQLEDILRQVYKKLNDRNRDLEQTVTSLEAAMASLEKPFKAVAERCAYGSRLLNAQSNQPAVSTPPPPFTPS